MLEDPTPLPTLTTMLWVLLGIVLSVVLPIAIGWIKEFRKPTERRLKLGGMLKKTLTSKYITVVAGAVIVAVFIVLVLGMEFVTTRDAVLGGFAWESLLAKSLA